MAWINLIIAGLLEIAWAIGLKYTDGFTKLGPSGHGSDNDYELLFSRAGIEIISVGTGYAVWTGIARSERRHLGLFSSGNLLPSLGCFVLC
jgi:quaternary ammonium compound-resistance protein SugE